MKRIILTILLLSASALACQHCVNKTTCGTGGAAEQCIINAQFCFNCGICGSNNCNLAAAVPPSQDELSRPWIKSIKFLSSLPPDLQALVAEFQRQVAQHKCVMHGGGYAGDVRWSAYRSADSQVIYLGPHKLVMTNSGWSLYYRRKLLGIVPYSALAGSGGY